VNAKERVRKIVTLKIVSFSGKGGVGKSTLLVLMLKYILESKKYEDVLVIDADPDANIGDIIGESIGFKQTGRGKNDRPQGKNSKKTNTS